MSLMNPTRACRWLLLPLFSLSAIKAHTSEPTYFHKDVKICSAKDLNLNKCFTDSANQMLKHLVKGIRKLNAVPMDPLCIPNISLGKNNTLIPTLAFNLNNTLREGWRDAVVIRSVINPKRHEFNIVIRIPRYNMRGTCDLFGSIIGIPVEGSGDVDITFFNMTNDMKMRGHLEERNAQEFLVIDDFQQRTDIVKLKVHLENVFNSTEISNATNNLLNQNNLAILDVGRSTINEIWGAMHWGLIQRIFDNVPYAAMFRDLD
ncbi:Circadian clock-controlled protein [Gryllus bimaculatus]|nr:Circadian clock-controlled protein [Gryllus bimaculatus]